MKFVAGFIAGSAIAAGAIMAVNPPNMRKIRRRCKYAKHAIKSVM